MKIFCLYCSNECKISDSRPHPNSKSKDRIHNRCIIKKNLEFKRKASNIVQKSKFDELKPNPSASSSSNSLFGRILEEELSAKRATNERKLNKLVEDDSRKRQETKNSSGQFFFDLKAGIAKPNEKRRFLQHRNLTELVARFDDNGFQEEAAGRAYDHTGKDLNTLGDDSEEETTSDGDPSHKHGLQIKRKSDSLEHRSNLDKRPSRIKLDEQNPCWFCLSSPLVEKHLIVAIGEYCYLALAKGGLDDEHLLLIPIEHIPNLVDESNPQNLFDELEQFKKSLVRYFGNKSKGVVFFERNFRTVHWQLQVVPIPLDILDTIGNDIKSTSKGYFKNSDYLDIPSNCCTSDIVPPSSPYLYWEIEPVGCRFVTQIQVKGSFFPIQLGRLVLTDSSILNCPEREDWKKCIKTKEEYVGLVKMFKDGYRQFDITSLSS